MTRKTEGKKECRGLRYDRKHFPLDLNGSPTPVITQRYPFYNKFPSKRERS